MKRGLRLIAAVLLTALAAAAGAESDLLKNALSVINFRYPTYHKEIATYIKNDPPKQLRHNLDIARLRHAAGKSAFLFVLHKLGGGTLKHAKELADLLAKEGIGTYFLQPDPDDGDASARLRA